MNDTVLQAIRDGVVGVDTAGVIEVWNADAERLLGFTAEDAVGQTLALIIPPESRPAHIAGFHRAMETGRTDTQGAPALVAATGKHGPVELEITIGVRRSLPGEAPHGTVAVLRGAGERRSLESYAASALREGGV
ncbi:PAS domain-containing protein [Streptomyces sp. CA-106131]|uniref:PAS domain-containing protein n=1 Tax=Streptomyces sp. CA-106131 TaxID=3240045 RepID=UPI003D909073